ncbi:hypothetical protein ACFFNY_17020 [Paenibacillus hodogayensis]|uniref:Uncharacterized protein n=1 Tax=Paenibacillus hodogayensis TaxID=279208 RepID=A0ABV5VY89_9BACL
MKSNRLPFYIIEQYLMILLKGELKTPFVPEVIEDESLVSYLYRFSLANHHEISWQAERVINKNQNMNIDTTKLSSITNSTFAVTK